MHCMVNGNKRMAGYVDFVCADQISTIEILSMAKDLKIDVQNCRIWWFDASTGNGSFKEIVTDGDALTMAMSVDCIKKHHVRIDLVDKRGIPSADCEDVTDAGGATYSGDEDDEDTDEEDLEELLTGSATNKKKSGEEVEIEDSDYTFNESSDDEVLGKKCMARAIVTVSGEQPELGSEYASVSEYATSDDLNSCSSTDSEEVIPRKPKYSEFNEQTDMRNPNLKIGMKFKDFKQFKEAVKNYGIKNRYVMKFRPNTKTRCKAYCAKGCPFYLWASLMPKDGITVQIKTGVLKHECGREHKNRHVNASWIAKTYMEQFRSDPTWKLAGIIQAVKTNQEVEITRLTAYRAKCIALREIDGDEKTQMLSLYDYRLELLRTHPGSTIKFRCDQGMFEAMYVCLSPLRSGFLAGCRRIISVDGCFLKGLYGGQLLTAVSIDGNNSIYPVAWSVVNKENRENWVWFLQLLSEDLMITESQHWAFMSDRQKGLINAIDELFPYSEHRFCVRHIHTNYRKNFRGKALKDQLWRCAKATYLAAFEKEMNILSGMSQGAFHYMKKIDPKHWSRAHFHEKFKCDMLLNNLCECFNGLILEARTKGIVTLNEMIRTQLMCRIQKRRDAAKNWKSTHCPRILKMLEKYKQMSSFYSTTWSGGSKYQVLGPEGQFIVDKVERSCSCRVWQLTGVPCSHAVLVIYYNMDKPENFLHECYTVNIYLDTYGHTLNPTHSRESWPRSDQQPMIPPLPVNKKRGRKTLLRRREDHEENTGFYKGKVANKGGKVTCGVCGAKGHNRRYHAKQGNMDSSEPSNNQHKQQVGNVYANIQRNMDSSEPSNNQHNQQVGNVYANIQGHQQQMKQPEHEEIPQQPMPQVIYTPGNTIPNCRNLLRRTKLGIRRGANYNKSQGAVQNTTEHTSTHLNKPGGKGQKYDDKTKEGDAGKRRRVWLPPGI